MTDLSDIASVFWRVIPSDPDPTETREWLDAFDSMLRAAGAVKVSHRKTVVCAFKRGEMCAKLFS